MELSEGVKERLGVVVDAVQTTFHWGFVPLVLYLGKFHFFGFLPHTRCERRSTCILLLLSLINLYFRYSGFAKGAEPGMPPLSILSLLWQ